MTPSVTPRAGAPPAGQSPASPSPHARHQSGGGAGGGKVRSNGRGGPAPYSPSANSTPATSASDAPTSVTRLGGIPAEAHSRVAHRAGRGQNHFVTRSVT